MKVAGASKVWSAVACVLAGLLLAGCAGDGLPAIGGGTASISSATPADPSAPTQPKAAAFNPFNDLPTERPLREVIQNPSLAEVMRPGPLPEFSIGRAENTALGVDTNDGLDHTLRVLYVPGTLEVYLDGALIITTPYSFSTGGTWIDSNMPVGGLDLIGGSAAYVGFTAGSGSVGTGSSASGSGAGGSGLAARGVDGCRCRAGANAALAGSAAPSRAGRARVSTPASRNSSRT